MYQIAFRTKSLLQPPTLLCFLDSRFKEEHLGKTKSYAKTETGPRDRVVHFKLSNVHNSLVYVDYEFGIH